VVRVDADHDPELFWAVRGAGSAFGIATAFEMIADPVGDVAFAELTFAATDLARFFAQFGTAVDNAPRILTASLLVGAGRTGRPNAIRVGAMVDSADPDEILSVLQPLAAIATLRDHDVRLRPYADVMAAPTGPQHGWGEPVSRSILVDRLSPAVARDLDTLLGSGRARVVGIRSAGGAVGDVGTQATAYAGRSASFSVVALGFDDASLDAAWAPLARRATGSYLSFESQLDAARLRLAFPPPTLERLQSVKRRVDPDDVFHDNVDLRRT
ncbi:MAG: FAD-binding protein, partial [Propionibacteriaceae bacterium]